MKKILIAAVALTGCFATAKAQTAIDANLLGNSNDINGTARYTSMAGAFSALGGNASAINDNPAGLGVYRKSEISTTLNLSNHQTNSTWYTQSGSDSKTTLNFNNLTYVIAKPTMRSYNTNTGLLSSNWSFSFDRVKNFDRNVYANGDYSKASMLKYIDYFTTSNNNLSYDDLSSSGSYNPYNNTNLSWMSIMAWNTLVADTASGAYSPFLSSSDQASATYRLQEKGHINKYTVAWSGNFSNKFYLGLSFDYYTITHQTSSYYTENLSTSNYDYFKLASNFETTGSGVGLTVGAIYRPVDNLRLGFAIHTPTFYSLTDHSYSDMQFQYYSTSKSRVVNSVASTPNDSYDDIKYQLISPMQINTGLAYVFNKAGVISFDYTYSNGSGMQLMDNEGATSYYSLENNDISNWSKDVHTIKVGAEYNLTENFAVRAGYAFKTASIDKNAVKYLNLNTTRTDTEFFLDNSNTNFYSLGLGYHEDSWFLDFAFQKKIYTENFYPYAYDATSVISASLEPASIKNTRNNYTVTFGVRF